MGRNPVDDGSAAGGPRPVPTGPDRSPGGRLIEAARRLSRAAEGGAAGGDDLLRALCEAAVLAVGADGAGVVVPEPDGLRFVHAEPDWALDLEQVQELHRRGPGWDALSGQCPIAVSDLTAAAQWPELADEVSRAGVYAMVSLPLVAQGRVRAVLDLFRRAPGAWSEQELAAAGFCLDSATAYLVLADERDHWRAAWTEAEHRRSHDELTGLPGRGLLFDRLEHAIAATGRRGGAVAVLFIDLDRFKGVNDAFGHAAGDAVLAEAARRLRAALRAGDTLARLSGDEFVVVCEDLAGSQPQRDAWLDALARRIQHELRRPVGGDHRAPGVTASIGAAVTTGAGDAQSLLSRSDRAMYEAKRAGGARLVISGPQYDVE